MSGKWALLLDALSHCGGVSRDEDTFVSVACNQCDRVWYIRVWVSRLCRLIKYSGGLSLCAVSRRGALLGR